MSETQSSYSPDSYHPSSHDTQTMAHSSTSNGTSFNATGSTSQQDAQFQGLFVGDGSAPIVLPGPGHWQPMSTTEVQSALKNHLSARSIKTEKKAKIASWMKMMAEGARFSVVIDTAINVHPLQRCVNLPDHFDVRGKLRVPWYYVLPKEIIKAKADLKVQLKQSPHKQTQPPSLARTTLGKGSEESRSLGPADMLLQGLCQQCRLRPVSDDGQSDNLCSKCAKLLPKRTRGAPTYSNQKNNKRLKMTPAVPAVPETPHASTSKLEIQIIGSRRLSSTRLTSTPRSSTFPTRNTVESSQSPDPLGFDKDDVPSSREKQDGPKCSPTESDLSTLNSSQIQKSPSSDMSTSEPLNRAIPLPATPLNNGAISLEATHLNNRAISIEEIPLHGEAWLDHGEKICQPLQHLSGILSSYVGTALDLVSANRASFVDMSFISHEDPNDPLVSILRGLLDIHEGVTLRAHIQSLSLDGEYVIWVKVVLMSLIKQFIFESGSPYEDTSILKKSLSGCGLLPDMVNMVVQDYQIRTMGSKPQQAPNFFQRKRVRQDAFVKRLNGTMHALVSSSSDINGFHVDIAKISSDLNMNMRAYNGVYEPIYPGRYVPFDPNLHTIDRPEPLGPNFNQKDVTGKPILFTVVVGVRYKTHGHDWVVVEKAVVRLWQPLSTINDPPPQDQMKKRAGG